MIKKGLTSHPICILSLNITGRKFSAKHYLVHKFWIYREDDIKTKGFKCFQIRSEFLRTIEMQTPSTPLPSNTIVEASSNSLLMFRVMRFGSSDKYFWKTWGLNLGKWIKRFSPLTSVPLPLFSIMWKPINSMNQPKTQILTHFLLYSGKPVGTNSQ